MITILEFVEGLVDVEEVIFSIAEGAAEFGVIDTYSVCVVALAI